MYDAPIDAYGRAKYAGDRKAHIVLADHERPVMRIAPMARGWRCRSADPFGRLERRHGFDGLVRRPRGG